MAAPSVGRSDGPELIFGLAGAVGTNLGLVAKALSESLSEFSYKSKEIGLSDLLHRIDKWKKIPSASEDERIRKHMDAGNSFRRAVNRGDALAILALGAIRKQRRFINQDANKVIPRFAFILRSLKHPDEVLALRAIYGPAFLLVSAYAPRETRIQYLASTIAATRHTFRTRPQVAKAQSLNERDEAELGEQLGQSVGKTFPLADVFVDASNPMGLQSSVKRFIELLFDDYPFHTPTRDEYGMFHAQAAALRSAALGRQVGAVIATTDGDIIAVGTNEVPKAGGGLYWSGDDPDHRDFTLGYDTNDKMKRNLLAEIFERLGKRKWLAKNKSKKQVDKLVEDALMGKKSPLLSDAQIMNLIEFGRSVHAEMSALADASRRGVAVAGCTLFTTTFPCHDCARHIVAAGTKRVVYIEPYPKSLAAELYPDSIVVDPQESGIANQVAFQPFVGVAPRKYMELFAATDNRKTKDGKIVGRNKLNALPRFKGEPPTYVRRENEQLHSLLKSMRKTGLTLIG